ncbi:hypothetical protein J6590_041417 [Homalodisca vitripennis]|nr:hypothetical protein J6590_041417 [Homalodisca vitripennis]
MYVHQTLKTKEGNRAKSKSKLSFANTTTPAESSILAGLKLPEFTRDTIKSLCDLNMDTPMEFRSDASLTEIIKILRYKVDR